MSLTDIVNQAAAQALAQPSAKPDQADVSLYYAQMEQLLNSALLPLQECIDGLKALPSQGERELAFLCDRGGHFAPRHFRIDVMYKMDNEVGHVQHPFYHDIHSFVILMNRDGALAGREAIDEMHGRYHIARDCGVRGMMERLAAWAAYKSPQQAAAIAQIFTNVERKYGLTAQGPGAPKI
ncbi:MAG: hypothetical protein KKA05_07935 [Alphaproteobacteria bacterium]|nr:hypothetical protein [Alphaproteobacteria bacterium]MBU0859989.1 hypothetical protein [Alphaproteobacteria bacterium]